MQEKKIGIQLDARRSGAPDERRQGAPAAMARFMAARFAAALALACLPFARAAIAKGIDLDRFSLAAPIVKDVDTNARFLVAGDFDGDGRKDFAVFDGQKNILRLFYSRDLAGDEPFEKEEMVLEQIVTGLTTADMNGDGRADILIGADPPSIMYQRKTGKLAPPEELQIEGATADAADLDGDGRMDMVTVKDQTIRIAIQNKDGVLEKKREYRSVYRVPGGVEIKDVDGDGRMDLIYLSPDNREYLAVRFQDKNGEFGMERLMKLGAFDSAQPASKFGNGKPGAALVDRQTGVLKVAQLEAKPKETPPVFSTPRLAAFDIESPTGRETVCVGGLEGTGARDIAVVSPETAKIQIYSVGANGSVERREAPSLQGVTQAQMVGEAKERARLWMLSPSEESLGILSAEGGKDKARFSFPRMLSMNVKPLAFAVGEFGGDPKVKDLVVGYRPQGSEGGELALALYTDCDSQTGRLDKATTIPLPRTKGAELKGLTAADVNNDGRTDLIAFFDYQQPRILLQDKNGGFSALEVEKSAGAGMLNQLAPSRVRVADVTGDSKNELLIARSSFARALSIGADGSVTVANQFNGKNAKSEIVAAAVANLDGGKHPYVVLLDSANNCLTVYGMNGAASAGGEYSLLKNEDLVGIAPRDLLASDLNGDGKDDLVVVANDRFGVIFGGVADTEFKTVQSYITDIPEGGYALTDCGDFGGDGASEIMAVEETENLLDFFRLGKDLALSRFYRFKMFEGVERSSQPQRRGGGVEPRELKVADFNGDGLPDLLMLCHREVLIYLAKEKTKAETAK